jgi:protoheme IX farnesyltransferase
MSRLPAYPSLFKPKSSLLLAYTGLTVYIYAIDVIEPYAVLLFALLGGLATMSANSLNNYFDRDIDVSMSRTRNRPIPRGLIPPHYAPFLGIPLIVLSSTLFVLWFNPLTGLLVLFGFIHYVLFYTVYLKRHTPLNTVIGGLAGAFPPLAGWAAATGGVGPEAVLLGAIVFFWTPGHFWSLSIRFNSDYKVVGLPILPSIAGVDRTVQWIRVFNILTAASILLSTFFFGSLIYRISALITVVLLGASSRLLYRSKDASSAWISYKVSSPILVIIFTGLLLSLL